MESCTTCGWFVGTADAGAAVPHCGLHALLLWQPAYLVCDDHRAAGAPVHAANDAAALLARVTVVHPEYRDTAADTIIAPLGSFADVRGWSAGNFDAALNRAEEAAQAAHDAAFAARQQARSSADHRAAGAG